MERVTIAQAVTILENLLSALNNAYWDASDIQQKDTVFDVISVLHEELNEMAKLSVEDHYMAYEPITANLKSCTRKFKKLQTNIEEWFPRTSTSDSLELSLSAANGLFTNHS